jgi:hypothetical protein
MGAWLLERRLKLGFKSREFGQPPTCAARAYLDGLGKIWAVRRPAPNAIYGNAIAFSNISN